MSRQDGNSFHLDPIDIRILVALQQDGRIQNARLAERVGLSPSPCLARTRRLERLGVVRRYAAVLDPARLSQRHVVVHVQVMLTDRRVASAAAFERLIRATPEAMSCHLVSGDYDYLVRFVCPSLQHFADLMPRLCAECPAIRTYHSVISILCVKDSGELPVDRLVSAP